MDNLSKLSQLTQFKTTLQIDFKVYNLFNIPLKIDKELFKVLACTNTLHKVLNVIQLFSRIVHSKKFTLLLLSLQYFYYNTFNLS